MMERVQLAWRDEWQVGARRSEQAVQVIERGPGQRNPRDCLRLEDLEEKLEMT